MQKRTIWRCGFCKKNLSTHAFRGIEWLLLAILFRPHRCPHCFEVRYRPIVPWFGSRPRPSRRTRSGPSSRRVQNATTRAACPDGAESNPSMPSIG